MTDKNDGVLAAMARNGFCCGDPSSEISRTVAAIAELLAADEEYDAATDAFRDSTQTREADRFSAAMKRRAAALRAMRGDA